MPENMKSFNYRKRNVVREMTSPQDKYWVVNFAGAAGNSWPGASGSTGTGQGGWEPGRSRAAEGTQLVVCDRVGWAVATPFQSTSSSSLRELRNTVTLVYL